MMPIMIPFSSCHQGDQIILSRLDIFVVGSGTKHMAHRINTPSAVENDRIGGHRQAKAKKEGHAKHKVVCKG